MNTARILTLKLAKRLRYRKDKYLSYVHSSRSSTSLPVDTQHCSGVEGAESSAVIFFQPAERESIVQQAQASSPDACRLTVENAEHICNGEIIIFGQRIDLSRNIPWHADSATGRTWPKIPAPRIGLVFPDTSDIKAPWELARFQFLPTLGRAWAYTGQEKHPRKARQIIESFLADNPYGSGIHWINPMEAAIRAANWIVALPFFDHAPGWDDEFVNRLKLALFDHGRFIRAHLERDGRGNNNNHYTANLAGLFIIGLYLSSLPQCRVWTGFALRELDAELNHQIARDGMHYENSFGYHRLTFDMFLSTQRLALLNGFAQVKRWGPALRQMADFTLAVMMPDGRMPNFGDNDDGVWLGGTARPPDDHRYLTYLSAAAFGRPDPKLVRPPLHEIPEEVFWYLGVDRATTLARYLATDREHNRRPSRFSTVIFGNPPVTRITHDKPCSSVSRVFYASGIVVMRSRDGYVLVSANPVGTGGIGGHKHNDLLSYVFTVGDFEIVVDPGTYAYTAEPALRNSLRSTAAHNTAMVDNAEQNRFFPRQLFWVREDAHPEIVLWESTDTIDRLTVRHDGYRRLPGKIIHTRTFVFHKDTNILLIDDELGGEGTHDIVAVTNFGEGALHADDLRHVVLTQRDHRCQAAFLFAADLPWRARIEPGWRSVRYRQKTTMFRMVQRCQAQLPMRWTTVIGAFAHGSANWRPLEDAISGGSVTQPRSRILNFEELEVAANLRHG